MENRYQMALNLENRIRSLWMYDVVLIWGCENPVFPENTFIPYPYYIVYDFEAVLEKRDLN